MIFIKESLIWLYLLVFVNDTSCISLQGLNTRDPQFSTLYRFAIFNKGNDIG